MEANQINKQVGKAVKWSSITEILAKLISPIVNMILARLLLPEAFGLVATVTMVVTFAQIFTDAGFQKYIVQHEFSDEDDLNKSTNVAFWTNLIFSLILFACIAIFADPIANLVGSEGAGNSIIVACITIPLVAFSSIQMARYRRSFDFKSLFFVRMVTAVLPLVVTIPLAVVFRSHWALILGTLSQEVANAVILTAISKWKPRFWFSFAKLKEMLSFSLWSMFEQVTIWLTSNVDIFIVGKILNEFYLGLYKTSMTTVNSYMGIITSATTPVLFAALSRYQNNDLAFQDVFFKFQRLVACLVLPMGVGLFLYRQLATEIFLGKNWSEAAGFIGLWGLTSSLVILFSNYNSEVYRSKGKPKLSMLSQLLHLIFLVVVLVVLAPKGFKVLYIGRSLARIQGIIVGAIIMRCCFKISFFKVIKNVSAPMIATICMGGIAFGLQYISSSVWWSFVSIAICIVAYFIILFLFPNMRREVFALPYIKKFTSKFFGKKAAITPKSSVLTKQNETFDVQNGETDGESSADRKSQNGETDGESSDKQDPDGNENPRGDEKKEEDEV